MNQFKNRIITASAGTGKTYRLSLEYISILLSYYEEPGFEISSILVITFTRKATAEIRQRILSHLSLLAYPKKADPKERLSLIRVLQRINPLLNPDNEDLEDMFLNRILSAYHEISADLQKLKVMTIDSYVSAIFRNLVRPQRSIETYDIDTEAARKRMADILSKIMTDDLKARVRKLLMRNIRPSLDEYEKFIISLIKNRWTYYLLDKRWDDSSQDSLQSFMRRPRDLEQQKKLLMEAFSTIMNSLNEVAQDSGGAWEDYFRKDFRQVFDHFPTDLQQMLSDWQTIISDPPKLHTVLKSCKEDGSGIINNNKLRKKIYQERKEDLNRAILRYRSILADYLLHELLYPQQVEIMDIWKIVLDEYDRLLYKYHTLSYDDIAWFSFEALYSFNHTNPDPEAFSIETEFYEFLSYRSRFILIDEFQDTSLIQFNILKPIIEEVCAGAGEKDYGGLIVVGDVKQSIFGWRGGERDLLLKLDKIIHSLQEPLNDTLDQSYRSSPRLMSFVNHCFSSEPIHQYLKENNLSWEYSPVESQKPELDNDSRLELIIRPHSSAKGEEHADLMELYNDFVDSYIEPIRENIKTESIAILCRRTKELADLQLILESKDITGVFEPSADLLTHRLISPLLSWLRYIAFASVYDLLAFLRSDFMLTRVRPFKEILQYQKLLQRSYQDPETIVPPKPALLKRLEDFAIQAQNMLPSQICQKLVDELLCPDALGQRDLLNLHAFLSVVSEFELNSPYSGISIAELLKYLEDNKHQDFLKQRGINQESGLQLMTIHKSKGLQFDRVFIFYNLSAGSGNDFGAISQYIKYRNEDYHMLEDFAITLSYDNILAASRFSQLKEDANRRELLEEMNILYVAYTRAKYALGIYYSFQSTASWPDYLADKEVNQIKLPMLLCESSRLFFEQFGSSSADYRYEFGADLPTSLQSDETSPESQIEPQSATLPYPSPVAAHEYLEQSPDERKRKKDWWLKGSAGLKGDLVHEYLSGLIRNLEEEREASRLRIYRIYGSLFTKEEMDGLCDEADRFCIANPWLFEAHWDKIFTEKSVWMGKRELRLDRLMIDTNRLQILIVDYKSGGITDKDQLKTYEHVLSNLDWVKARNYAISTRFIKIDLSHTDKESHLRT